MSKVPDGRWKCATAGTSGGSTPAAVVIAGHGPACTAMFQTILGRAMNGTDHIDYSARRGPERHVVAAHRNHQNIVRSDIVAQKFVLWPKSKGALIECGHFYSSVDGGPFLLFHLLRLVGAGLLLGVLLLRLDSTQKIVKPKCYVGL